MVAVESPFLTKLGSATSCGGSWLACVALAFVAFLTTAGTWTVYDLGPDLEMESIADDREGGVWVMLGRVKDVNDVHLVYHVTAALESNNLEPPPGGRFWAHTYYPWLGANQGRLSLIIKQGDYGIWDYVNSLWTLIGEASSINDSAEFSEDGGGWLNWGWTTSDGRRSAGFYSDRTSSGGVYPWFGLANKLAGTWTAVEDIDAGRLRENVEIVRGHDDGAFWVLLRPGSVRSGLWRVDWNRTCALAGSGSDSVRRWPVLTHRGTIVYALSEGTDDLTIVEDSLRRGVLSGLSTDESLIGRCERVFGASISFSSCEGGLFTLSPSGEGTWDIRRMAELPEQFRGLPHYNGLRMVIDARGSVWIYSLWRQTSYVAVYDRSDELIDPTITLTVGLDVIEPQDTTVVNASIAPGQRTYEADIYAVAQTPSGELWSYPWNEPGIHPVAENLHFDPHTFVSDFILLHIEPPMPFAFGQDGEYIVYVALTEPGTLNPIGEIAYVPFELRLAQ